MDSISSAITKAVNDTVAAFVKQHTVNVVAASKGLFTYDQVIAMWNTSFPSITVENDKSPPSRATKTDPNNKCRVEKKTGPQIGKPCGRPCVRGKPTCQSHIGREADIMPEDPEEEKEAPKGKKAAATKSETKESKTEKTEKSDSAPKVAVVPPASHVIPPTPELNGLTVTQLKVMAREQKVPITTKDRKDDIVTKLAAHRDAKRDEKSEKSEKKPEPKKEESPEPDTIEEDEIQESE